MPLPRDIETPHGLSVEGASPELLTELLPQLEDELRIAGVPVDRYLAPGLSQSNVEQTFLRIGLHAPREVTIWFGWHNGVVTSEPAWNSFPRFQFYPLSAVERRYTGGGWPHGYEEWQWNPSWIQLLGDNNGLAVDCSSTEGSPLIRAIDTTGEWGTQLSSGHAQVVSLCTPVTWWIESLRAGEYMWQPEANGWDWDFAKAYDRDEKRAFT